MEFSVFALEVEDQPRDFTVVNRTAVVKLDAGLMQQTRSENQTNGEEKEEIDGESQKSSESLLLNKSRQISKQSDSSSPKKKTQLKIKIRAMRRVGVMSKIQPPMNDCMDNFILFGEIFCYLKAFQSYGRMSSSSSPNHCYLSDFRPVVSTSIKGSMICAELDDSFSTPYNISGNSKENSIRQTTMNSSESILKIDLISAKLRSLGDITAYNFSKYLQGYRNLIMSYSDKVNEVHEAYNYNLNTIQGILANNFKSSEKLAYKILSDMDGNNKESADQQNSTTIRETNMHNFNSNQDSAKEEINEEHNRSSFEDIPRNNKPEIILQYFIKRLDSKSLTNKTCMTGGNRAFMELISGSSDDRVIQYNFSKMGTPEVLDWKGIVEITLAQFSGNSVFYFDLQTIDGYSIPAKSTYACHSLSSFELIPGFVLSDVLETYAYEINPQILKCLRTKRKLTVSNPKQTTPHPREDMAYTIESEIFLSKFYPHVVKQEKARKFKLTANSHRAGTPLLSLASHDEIQSDIFRINRQVNQKII